MKYIKSLLEFARIANVATTRNPYFKEILNKYTTFDKDEELISNVYIEDLSINLKKNIEIGWYNTDEHSIINKITGRTQISSVSEFNDIIENSIKSIIPSEVGKKIAYSGRYALYLKNRNFYIIMYIYTEDEKKSLFNNDSKIYIITINKTTPNKCRRIINIDDK